MPDDAHPAGTENSLARHESSLARHLTRGAIGFGLIGSAIALTPSLGPAALLLAPPGAVALRGCPTCWIADLVQTVSNGRMQRDCTDTGCTLHPAQSSPTKRALPHAGD